jgi:RimJ/RimL family protein N-acetyltransferase
MIIVATERLSFRPHEEADLDAYCEMMADPEFRRLCGGKPLLREEAERSLRSILIGQQDWLRPKPMGLFATILKQEGRYIGRCGVYPHRNEENLVIPGEGTLGTTWRGLIGGGVWPPRRAVPLSSMGSANSDSPAWSRELMHRTSRPTGCW